MEIVGLASDEFRYRMWVSLITGLNIATLFIVPLLLINRAVGALLKQHSQKYLVLAILFSTYTLFIFYRLMREKAQLTPGGDPDSKYLLLHAAGAFSPAVQFNFISKIGVGIISVLSGFSSVYLPFEFFRYYDPLISQINKTKIEEDMAAVLEEIKNEKTELAQLSLESETPEEEVKPQGLIASFLGGVFGKKLNKFEQTLEQRKKAVKLNQQILNSLFLDYSEISKEERNSERAQNNKMWSFFEKSLAIALLIYGCYKVLTTVFYLLLGRNKPTDPISVTLKMAAK